MERISLDYGRKTKLEFVVYPSREIAVSVMEPYNTILAAHAMREHCDCAFMIDN